MHPLAYHIYLTFTIQMQFMCIYIHQFRLIAYQQADIYRKTHINQQLSQIKLQIHLRFNLKTTTSSPIGLKLLFHLTYLPPYHNVKISLYLPPITLLPTTPSLKEIFTPVSSLLLNSHNTPLSPPSPSKA